MNIDRKYKPELIASKDITREQLNEPYFDQAKSVVVATDGHCLARVPVVSEDGDTTGQIPASALKQARKARSSVILREKAELPTGESFPRKDIRFPPYELVIPAYRAGEDGVISVAFNARLLKSLADALGSDNGVVTLSWKDELDPIVVTTHAGDEAIGVLMPCRR